MRRPFAAFAAVLALLAAAPAPAAAEAPRRTCAAFPHVAWWGEITHESVTRAVHARHNGDWQPVISELIRQMAAMTQLRAQGRSYAVPNSTRQLNGEPLARHLGEVRTALSVLYCLRDNDRARQNAQAQTPAPGRS
jgi:hypothetical protein